MKGFVSASSVSLLLIVVLFTTSCNTSSTVTNQVITCFGDIGVKVIASASSGDEPLAFSSLLTVVPECINAAIAAFAPVSNSAPSSPQIDIHESSTDGSSTGAVYSNTWSNCTDNYQTLQFNFSVPFEMIVGPQSNQGTFDSSPSGSSDNELIAHQLFEQYGNYIRSITTSGPSQSVLLNVPPQTKITLSLPIQLSYKEGEARIVHTDGSTISLPWLFTNGYQQAGQITSSTSSC